MLLYNYLYNTLCLFPNPQKYVLLLLTTVSSLEKDCATKKWRCTSVPREEKDDSGPSKLGSKKKLPLNPEHNTYVNNAMKSVWVVHGDGEKNLVLARTTTPPPPRTNGEHTCFELFFRLDQG